MKKYKAKLLNEASNKVGTITTTTFFWMEWSGEDLLLTGLGKGEHAKTIDPKGTYIIKVPFIQEQSCKKELKRRMKNGGFQGGS
jgi:hypothetical protein